jgi:hypothetical protein
VVLCVFSVGYFTGYTVAQTGLIAIEPASLSGDYSYLIETDGTYVWAKSGKTGEVVYGGQWNAGGVSGTNASAVIQNVFNAISSGDTVVFKGDFTLSNDVQLSNKAFVTLTGRAKISGGRILLYGDDWRNALQRAIKGLRFYGSGAGVKIYGAGDYTLIDHCYFEGCSIGVEVHNTKQWCELTIIRDSHFRNCGVGIQFTTPTSPGTNSYKASRIDHVGIELNSANQVGINLQSGGSLYDAYWTNVNFWANADNVIGIKQACNAYQGYIKGLAAECMIGSPTNVIVYQIESGVTRPFYLEGFSVGGTWTNWVNNLAGVDLFGRGQLFKETDLSVPIGLSGNYGTSITRFHDYPGMLHPKVKITIGGTVGSETITVLVGFGYFDGTYASITKTFTATGSIWLSDDDYLSLYRNNLLRYIQFKAKTTAASTSATCTVSYYTGTG